MTCVRTCKACPRTGLLGKPGAKPETDGKLHGTIPPLARLPLVVVVDVPHHGTQRGNGFIPAADSERRVYLDLLG